MAYQRPLHGGYRDGENLLIRDLLAEDPEMLNLAIGLLFSYNLKTMVRYWAGRRAQYFENQRTCLTAVDLNA